MEPKPEVTSNSSRPSVLPNLESKVNGTDVAGDPEEPSGSESAATAGNLRRRGCCVNPACCLIIENTIYITIVIGIVIDLFCIGFWVYLASLHQNIWNFHYARESNIQMLILHCFCLVFNVVLFFGTTMENVLLCLSWLVMRGIWYFGTLVAWIRSFDVLEFNGQLSSGAGAMLDDRETLLWKIVFFGYWPLMIIYGWFSLLVIVFTCRIITTSDRRRLLDRQVRVQ